MDENLFVFGVSESVVSRSPDGAVIQGHLLNRKQKTGNSTTARLIILRILFSEKRMSDATAITLPSELFWGGGRSENYNDLGGGLLNPK